MSKYRKKPVVIEAIQLRWDTWGEMCAHADVGRVGEGKPQGCYIDWDGNPTDNYPGSGPEGQEARIGLYIPTLEGLMVGTEGDWIIRGVKGELYPCKPDIFAATYEPVEEEI